MRLALVLPVVLAGLALPAKAEVSEGLSFAYRCEGQVGLQVAYVNAPGGESYAVVGREEGLAVLKAGPTGSGVRYVSIDGTGLVWHVKGPEGFLARDDASETMVLEGCKQD
jgi:membrane-bound inhibitor of C-type lysozyme